jgi:hypothetical protein
MHSGVACEWGGGEWMTKRTLITIVCTGVGGVIAALGAIVIFIQLAEWWSFGNWNGVSIRYVLGYYKIQSPYFASPMFRFLDLPLSPMLLGIGVLIVTIGAKYARKAGVGRRSSELGTGPK